MNDNILYHALDRPRAPRPDPPLSPHKQSSLRIGPEPSRGAKRRKRTLDGEDRSATMKREGKRGFFQAFPRPKRAGTIHRDNHSGMRQIEESGFAALLVLTMPYPPSERAANIIDHCGIKKHPIFRLSQPVSSRSANRTARHVE